MVDLDLLVLVQISSIPLLQLQPADVQVLVLDCLGLVNIVAFQTIGAGDV